MAYISFLDLLGTKNLMESDTDEYAKTVAEFNAILENVCGNGSWIYAFSDCAYLENETLEKLLDTLDYLRDALMEKGRFFTAAVTQGALEASVLGSNFESKVKGFAFGAASISRVYVLQSSMKGIGIQIDRALYDGLAKEKSKLIDRITCNYCIPVITDKPDAMVPVEMFYDLLLCPSQIVNQNEATINGYFSYIIEQYIKSNIRSQRYGRYYLSPMINLLNSFTFKQSDFDVFKDGSIQCNYEIINAFLNGEDRRLRYLFKNANGFDYILLILLNKLYDDFQGIPNKITYCIIKIMVRRYNLEKYILNKTLIPKNLHMNRNLNLILDDYYRVILERDRHESCFV